MRIATNLRISIMFKPKWQLCRFQCYFTIVILNTYTSDKYHAPILNSPPSLSDGALFRLREGGVYWSLLISLYTWSFLFLQYVQTAEVQTTTYIRRKKGKSEHLPSTSPTQKSRLVWQGFHWHELKKTLSAVDGAQMELLLSICSFMVY